MTRAVVLSQGEKNRRWKIMTEIVANNFIASKK